MYLPGPIPTDTAGVREFLSRELQRISIAFREIDDTSLDHARTPAEIALGVIPVDRRYPPGHARRFALLNNSADDTTALTNWAKVPGYHYYPAETGLIGAAIALASNSTFETAQGGVVKTSVTNISMFAATSKTNIKIRGGKFLQTAAGANAYVGQILLDGCTDCSVKGVELEGYQWAAILLNNSDDCTINDNHIHDFLGSVQDSSDICLYRQSRRNTVTENRCYGRGYVGIFAQDPGSSLIPSRNIIAKNKVKGHSGYGIARYNIDGANSHDVIDANIIEDIAGTHPSGGYGGNGVYVQNSGGVIVSNNNIRNCCTATSTAGLAPGGIGVNNVNSPFDVTLTAAPNASATSGTLTGAWARATGTYNVLFIETAGGATEIRVATLTNGSTAITWVSGLTNNCNAAATTEGQIPITISGNNISDIASSNTNAVTIGLITIASSTAGANLTGNTLFQGAGSVAGIACNVGVFVNGSDNVSINGGSIFIDPSITNSSCVFLYANGRNIANFTINVPMKGGSFGGLYSASSAAFTISNVTVNGSPHSGGGASCISYRLGLMNDAAFSGNVCNATVQALDVSGCLRVRFTGNSFISAGANAVTTAGTCTGSYFDKSNYAAGSGGAGIESIQNAATGLIVEQFGSAAPSANNRAVGDRVEQSVPVVGNPKGWRNTVAGTPGTNPSEGNLL